MVAKAIAAALLSLVVALPAVGQTPSTQAQTTQPPPERPSTAEMQAAKSLANTDWGKGLPAFSFALSKLPVTQSAAQRARPGPTISPSARTSPAST